MDKECSECHGEGVIPEGTGYANSEGGEDWRLVDCPRCAERGNAMSERKYTEMRERESNEEVDAVWRVVDTWREECNRAEARHRALEQRIRELVEKWRYLCDGNYDPTMCERCDCADELVELCEVEK